MSQTKSVSEGIRAQIDLPAPVAVWVLAALVLKPRLEQPAATPRPPRLSGAGA